MQHTALAFSIPARLIFNGLYRPRQKVQAGRSAARHMDGYIGFAQEVPAPLERKLYLHYRRFVDRLAHAPQRMQSGSVNRYVAYVFAIVMAVLL